MTVCRQHCKMSRSTRELKATPPETHIQEWPKVKTKRRIHTQTYTHTRICTTNDMQHAQRATHATHALHRLKGEHGRCRAPRDDLARSWRARDLAGSIRGRRRREPLSLLVPPLADGRRLELAASTPGSLSSAFTDSVLLSLAPAPWARRRPPPHRSRRRPRRPRSSQRSR